MSKVQVLLEIKSTPAVARHAFAAVAQPEATLEKAGLPSLPGVDLDASFPAIPLPTIAQVIAASPFGAAAMAAGESTPGKRRRSLAMDAESAPTVLVRGEVDEKDLDKLDRDVSASDKIVNVFADVTIEPMATCPSGAVGTHLDVERLLCAEKMRRAGMDGSGVTVAIVDTGVNIAYLNAQGKTPLFDAARSWVPQAGLTPGQMPVDHGTMCAFDVCIAAPRCTLLDIAVLASTASGGTVMEGLLSDAVRAYNHLLTLLRGPTRPGQNRSLVVNNSWGMFQSSWDYPVGHPGNYSDNPNHPFNRIVGTLEAAGADILFAAGNCGPECPDGRCAGQTSAGIYGANSHPAVLSIAGATINKVRIGYSTKGPGRLTRNKPDLTGYTHFRGSGVYAADGGTSAATPVVAGVVAAVRTKRPLDPASPASTPAGIRALLTSTAEDLGAAGYDLDHGYGLVNGCSLVTKFETPGPGGDICRRYPWLCRRPLPRIFCELFPWACAIPIPDRPGFPPLPQGATDAAGFAAAMSSGQMEVPPEEAEAALGYLLGYYSALADAPQSPRAATGGGGCGCAGAGGK